MAKLKSATVLPPAPEIINERPVGMDYKEYREKRKASKEAINARIKKGFLVHLSNEVLMSDSSPSRPIGMRQYKGITFKGNTKMLQII